MEAFVRAALVVSLALSALSTILMVGRPRRPMTAAEAAFAVLRDVGLIGLLILVWEVDA